jgi:hypothetical protein
MKKALRGFAVKGFRNNYLAPLLITIALFFQTAPVTAQLKSPLASSPKHDSTRVLSPVNADGFDWAGVGRFAGGLVPPQDTFKLSQQNIGAIADKNGKMYRWNGKYWEELGLKRILQSGDNSILFTETNDTIDIRTSAGVTISKYLVSTGGVELEDSTVTVLPDIIFYRQGLDTITSSSSFIVNTLPTGYKQYIRIYIKADNDIDTAWGNIDTVNVIYPIIPTDAIAITHVYVNGSVITVEQPAPDATIVHWGGDTTLTPVIGAKNNVGVSIMTDNKVRAEFTNTGSFVMKEKNTSGISDSYTSTWLARSPASSPVQQYLNIGMLGVFPNGTAQFTTNGIFDFNSSTSFYQYENNPVINGIGTLKLRGTSTVSLGNSTIGSANSTSNLILRVYGTSSGNTEHPKLTQTGDGRVKISKDSTGAAHASAGLELNFPNKGLLIPRVSADSMNAISSPATGLLIFNTTAGAFYYYTGVSWIELGASGPAPTYTLDDVATNGNEVLNKNIIVRADPNLDDNSVTLHHFGFVRVKSSVPTKTAEYSGFRIKSESNNYNYPDGIIDSNFYFPFSFRLNGNYYNADNTGKVDFGSIGTPSSVTDSIAAHNVRIGAAATTLSKITSGSYQPTITSVANLDAVSISVCMWQRIDSVVTISGRFTFDPTSGGQTTTRARFTLPTGITSNFTNEWDASGTAALNINTSGVNYGGIKADTANDQIEIFFYPSTTASFNYFFTGQFIIK